jgi:Transglycosylase SLT domain
VSRRNITVLAGGLLIGVPIGLVVCLMFLGEATQQQLCNGGATDVSAAGQPPLVQFYIGASNRYALGQNGYAYLAAINNVETTFGTNLSTSTAGAIGWMQFEPGTFRTWGVAVSRPGGTPDAYDPQDAIYSAANYLHASGAPQSWSAAIFAYNHSSAYVAQVQALAARYSGPNGLQNLRQDIAAAWGGKQPTGLPAPSPTLVSYSPPTSAAGCCPNTTATPRTTAAVATGACGGLNVDVTPVPGPVAVIMPNGLARPPARAPRTVQAMVAAADRINHFDYQYGGGHAQPALSDSQTHPQPQGGDRPGDNGTPGYDCSGSTAYVLFGGGLGSYFGGMSGSVPASGDFGSFGATGRGRWVTWYYNGGHVFIAVAGIVFDTGHQFPAQPSTPSTGPRWTIAADVAAQQTADGPFAPQHPAGL